MKLLKNRESGQVLIMALLMLGIGGLLTVPSLNLASTGLKYHQVVERNTLEIYTADSGVEYAVCKLSNNPEEYKTNPLEHSFTINARTVHVTAEYYMSNVYKITSTATSGSGSSTSIVSYVSMIASPFDYGMAATDGDINLSGHTEVTSPPDLFQGNIYANGAINLSGKAEVLGDATATGEVTLKGSASITGDVVENLGTPLFFAEIDTSPYLGEADNGTLIEGDLHISGGGYYELGPAHITGSLTITANTVVKLTGTVWVDGSITMDGNTRIEGPGTLVAVGDIWVTGNAKLTIDNIPLIISTNGDITVTGNSWTSAILHAPNRGVTLSGDSKVCGAVVGQSITGQGNNEVEYLPELRGRDDLSIAGGVYVISYTIN